MPRARASWTRNHFGRLPPDARGTTGTGRPTAPVVSPSAMIRSTRGRCGDRWHTGSVAPGSPVSSNAWQRHPPWSSSRCGQLRHSPVRAAEAGEGRRVVPDGRQVGLTDVHHPQPRDATRDRARQHITVRGDRQLAAAPTVHARLGQVLGVVGDHVHDVRTRACTAPGRTHRSLGGDGLGPGRQQRRAVPQRPAVVPGVGQLQPVGADAFRQGGVEGQRIRAVGAVQPAAAIGEFGQQAQRPGSAFSHRSACQSLGPRRPELRSAPA